MGVNNRSKPELIAFSQNLLGGVQSFYFNLLNFDPYKDFNKRWLLTKDTNLNYAEPPNKFNLGEKVINFSESEGRWRIAKKISKHISTKDGLILTNHATELDSLLLYPKNNKTIFHIVHDHLYLDISKTYEALIDVFITHNYQLYLDLKNLFPKRIDEIFYLPYGIKFSDFKRSENVSNKLKVAFIARLHQDKGIYDLLKIDFILKQNGVEVQWLITGDGPERANFLNLISKKSNFRHLLFKSSHELYSEIKNCDIFLLPSILDGTPVALIEAMSVGLVPIVYNFNKGIDKIISDDIGFIINLGDYKKISDVILFLNTNRNELEIRSENAYTTSHTHFNIEDRAKDYYRLFRRYKEFKKARHPIHVSIPLLENPLIPLFLVKMIRKVKKKIIG